MNAGKSGSLAGSFRRLIESTGPISLAHYMGESNARYYSGKDPLGGEGDFITAPEISQMFGELIGLWLADMWISAGRTEPVHYVELGPGRGTLARDALTAMRRYGLEPSIHFVETSTALKEIQLDNVRGATWHNDLSTIPAEGPVLVVGNEFLDAMPVRQLLKTEQGWRELMVVPRDDKFICITGDQPMDLAIPEARREAEVDTLIETSPAAASIVYEVAGRLATQQGAALFIDYGHDRLRTGSTLQAVKAHRKVDPFVNPGECDITAHVDFATLGPMAETRGAKLLGTVPQGEWLRALGIETRAESLSEFAPQYRDEIHSAKDRLIGEGQMGLLFKVMGLAHKDWPSGVGF